MDTVTFEHTVQRQIIKIEQSLRNLQCNLATLDSDVTPGVFKVQVIELWSQITQRVKKVENENLPIDVVEDIRNTQSAILMQLKTYIAHATLQSEKSGDAKGTDEWINICASLNPIIAQEFNDRLKLAINHYTLRRIYADCHRAYQSALSELDKLSNRLDDERRGASMLNTLERTIDSLGKFLAEYRGIYDPIQSFDATNSDWDEKFNKIAEWLQDCEQKANPLRDAHSILQTKAVSEKFSESLRDIREKKRLGLRVTFPTSVKSNEPREMSADEAEIICMGRWQLFSAEKYRKYINEAEDRLKSLEGPYETDPRKILEGLNDSFIKKDLISFDDLEDSEVKDLYKSYMPRLQKAADKVQEVADQISACDGSDFLSSYRRIIPLLHKLSNAPCLENWYQETRKMLREKIRVWLLGQLDVSRTAFKINLSEASRTTQRTLEQLGDIDEFPDVKSSLESLNKLSASLLKDISQLPSDPGEALQRITSMLKLVTDKHESIPEELSQLQYIAETTLEPSTTSEDVIRDIDERLPSTLEAVDVADIGQLGKDLEKVKNCVTSLGIAIQSLESLNKKSSTQGRTDEEHVQSIGKLKGLVSELDNIECRLNAFYSYRLAQDELKKNHSDLSKVDRWLEEAKLEPLLMGDNENKGLLYLKQLRNTKAQDEQIVQDALRKTETLLDEQGHLKNKKVSIEELLNIYKGLNEVTKHSTTQMSRLLLKKTQTRQVVAERIRTFLLAMNPKQKQDELSINKCRQYLGWIQEEFPNDAAITPATGILYEAEAWAAMEGKNWSSAERAWEQARKYGRSEAHWHQLACLKAHAIQETLEKESYGALLRALTRPALKRDHELAILDALRLFEIEESPLRDPDTVSQVKSIAFTNCINRLKGLMGLLEQSESIQAEAFIEETALKKGDQFLLDSQMERHQVQRVWEQYLYATKVPAVPDTRELLEKFEKWKKLYFDWLTITNLVTPKSSLRNLRSGKQLVDTVLGELKDEHGVSANASEYEFADLWEKYRSSVLKSLRRNLA